MHLGIGATSPTMSRQDIYEIRSLVVHCPSLPITSRDDHTLKRIFGGG